MSNALPDLAAIASSLPLAEVPALVGMCAQAQAIGLARLTTPAPPLAASNEGSSGDRLLTVAEAAEVAGVPVKRIYEWSRSQKWAYHPTKRCLRINEAGFRRWLVASSSNGGRA